MHACLTGHKQRSKSGGAKVKGAGIIHTTQRAFYNPGHSSRLNSPAGGICSRNNHLQSYHELLGDLLVSWLLRNHLVGFATVVPGEVVPECLIPSPKKWCCISCGGASYDESQKFAANPAAITKSISDLQTIFNSIVV